MAIERLLLLDFLGGGGSAPTRLEGRRLPVKAIKMGGLARQQQKRRGRKGGLGLKCKAEGGLEKRNKREGSKKNNTREKAKKRGADRNAIRGHNRERQNQSSMDIEIGDWSELGGRSKRKKTASRREEMASFLTLCDSSKRKILPLWRGSGVPKKNKKGSRSMGDSSLLCFRRRTIRTRRQQRLRSD